MKNITVLFPGGFKPITGAHLELANRYAAHPQVDRVIMLVGPKSRDGITRDKTIQLFNLLNKNPNIEIRPTNFNSPITAAYEYLFELPENTSGRYAMAASTKGDDYVRTKSFVPNVDAYKITGDKNGRLIAKGIDAIELNLDVDPLAYNTGDPISASIVRKSIAKNDYKTFKASYPKQQDAVISNAWELLTDKPALTKEWWIKNLQPGFYDMLEGSMGHIGAKKHKKKIEKLKRYLKGNSGKQFVYDFKDFERTVFGADAKTTYGTNKLNESKQILSEGGAGGHMNHPYDDHSLTFNDMKEMVSRALQGRLDIEEAVTEKTDGQNIFVTFKDGQIGFARGVRTIKNPMSVQAIQDKFAGRGAVSRAFGLSAEDLAEAFSRVDQKKLNGIFKNGKVFANMEIIYPETKNTITYEIAVLQFHNLVEFDLETGQSVLTDMTGGKLIQSVVQEANAHLQKTFSFIPPHQIKLGRITDFEDQQEAFYNEIDQLKDRYALKETELVTEYHKAWWAEVIEKQATKMNYSISETILDNLVYRWAFNIKSPRITNIIKDIDSDEFSLWVNSFDKNDFKTYQKQNMEPFENIFLRLGVVVLKNAQNFLSANPEKSVQDLKREFSKTIEELQTTDNIDTLNKLEHQLKKIEQLGGIDAIVPTEGVVFVFKGKTYKLTGAFAPINQVVGALKYAR
jgi:hypothetical protein